MRVVAEGHPKEEGKDLSPCVGVWPGRLPGGGDVYLRVWNAGEQWHNEEQERKHSKEAQSGSCAMYTDGGKPVCRAGVTRKRGAQT